MGAGTDAQAVIVVIVGALSGPGGRVDTDVELLGLSSQGHIPGLRVTEGGRFGVQCGEFRIQCGQLGPRLAGFGLFEVGLAAGGGLCAAELVQRVAGVKARSGPLQLGGQSVQCGGIACMAGRIGAGRVPAGEQGGKLGLLFDPLAAEGFGLLGPAQRLLELVQLCLGLSPGGSGGACLLYTSDAADD